MQSWVSGARLSAVVCAVMMGAATAAGAAPAAFPTFCQGIAIQGSQNRMFVSEPFNLPLAVAPESGPLRDPALGGAFAAEVKTRTGQTLLDYSCYARPDQAGLDAFLQSTLESNKANWAIERLAWRPANAQGPSTTLATPAFEPPPRAAAPPSPPLAKPTQVSAPPPPTPAPPAAKVVERAPPPKPVAPPAPAVEASDAGLAALNNNQAQAAGAARQKFEAEQSAYEARQRDYQAQQRAFQEQERAYRAAQVQHDAAVKASAAARQQWEADVAACRAGDRARCAPEPGTSR